MSHQSGIAASPALRDAFGNAHRSESIRLIHAQIVEETVELIGTVSVKGGSALDELREVPPLLAPTVSSYVFFRLDSRGHSGFEWLLLTYVPDKSKVKEKMLYASSRAGLKQQLGSSYFVDEIFGTTPAEFSREGYEAHRTHKMAEAPLTDTEREKAREVESGEIYRGGSSSYVHGVAFPVRRDLMDQLQALANDSINFVSAGIDLDKEELKLESSKRDVTLEQISQLVPDDRPLFIYYRYKHVFEHRAFDSFVFIYTCPDGSGDTKAAPVRMRMLYSSSKARAQQLLTDMSCHVSKAFEFNRGEEITEEYILNELHPPAAEDKKAFARPMRPGKGARKLIR